MGQSPVLDWGEFSVTPIPEPATIALLSIGLVGITWASYRRKFRRKPNQNNK